MMAPADKEGVVRKSRFSVEEMVSILREADWKPVGEVAGQAERISDSSELEFSRID